MSVEVTDWAEAIAGSSIRTAIAAACVSRLLNTFSCVISPVLRSETRVRPICLLLLQKGRPDTSSDRSVIWAVKPHRGSPVIIKTGHGSPQATQNGRG